MTAAVLNSGASSRALMGPEDQLSDVTFVIYDEPTHGFLRLRSVQQTSTSMGKNIEEL